MGKKSLKRKDPFKMTGSERHARTSLANRKVISSVEDDQGFYDYLNRLMHMSDDCRTIREKEWQARIAKELGL